MLGVEEMDEENDIAASRPGGDGRPAALGVDQDVRSRRSVRRQAFHMLPRIGKPSANTRQLTAAEGRRSGVETQRDATCEELSRPRIPRLPCGFSDGGPALPREVPATSAICRALIRLTLPYARGHFSACPSSPTFRWPRSTWTPRPSTSASIMCT